MHAPGLDLTTSLRGDFAPTCCEPRELLLLYRSAPTWRDTATVKQAFGLQNKEVENYCR